jgi:UDP-N-acetylmuramoyl-L-alanyl-D-glutamate--2,6-diaminopimelate ligase
VHVKSRLVGRPNVSNVLATVATATALDIPVAPSSEASPSSRECPDVSSSVSSSQDDVTVVIDYAHTDDALKNLLETARPLAHRRVITVFGCGGDRDRTKRPLMGAVAARLSDIVVMTSDNPRTEDPARIIEEIKRGVPSASDRAAATFHDSRSQGSDSVCDQESRSGDLVLLAGKGHEQTQVIGAEQLPFDEAAIAREALERRR